MFLREIFNTEKFFFEKIEEIVYGIFFLERFKKLQKKKCRYILILQKRHMGFHGLNSNNNTAIFKTTFMGTE